MALYDDGTNPYAPTPQGLAFLDSSPLVEPGDLNQSLRDLLPSAVESCLSGSPRVARSLEPRASLFALWCRVNNTGIDPAPVTELVVEVLAFLKPSMRYGLPNASPSDLTNKLSKAIDLLQQADEFASATRATIPIHEPIEHAKKPKKKQTRERWLHESLILLKNHPDWTDAKIAEQVGVHRGTLSRDKMYQRASATHRDIKENLRRGHLKFDPDSGQTDVEAHDSDS